VKPLHPQEKEMKAHARICRAAGCSHAVRRRAGARSQVKYGKYEFQEVILAVPPSDPWELITAPADYPGEAHRTWSSIIRA
jgi:hypothetical protein